MVYSARLTPVRLTPVRLTPVRLTPVRLTPVRPALPLQTSWVELGRLVGHTGAE